MKLDLETKTKAVGEVFLGTGTLEVIGGKYGISSSYLSTLAARAKRSMARKGQDGDPDILSLNERANQLSFLLKDKISELQEIKDKMITIGAELEKQTG